MDESKSCGGTLRDDTSSRLETEFKKKYYKKFMLLTTRCSVTLLTINPIWNTIVKNFEERKGAEKMIAGYGSKPIFQYKFRPFGKDARAADGGFSVILYENGILSFSTYDAAGAFLDELCFSLPPRVRQCFYGLLRNASSWLGATPCDLRGREDSPYGSSFAFDGYDPIRVFGMNMLLVEPCGSAGGFFARHLYVLFEDVCNLFAENGINLSLDGFTWNTNQVQPFRKNQMFSSGAQQRVI